MFFRITGHADAEVRFFAVDDVGIQITSFIHTDDLAHHVERVFVAVFFGCEFVLELAGVAAKRQYIVDSQEIKVDQRIFRLFHGKAPANQVRHRVHAIAVHDGRANAHGAGAFADGCFFVVTRRAFVVNELLAVIRDVDERRFELHQGVEGIKNGLHAAAFERGQHFEGDQCFVFRFFKMFGNFHDGGINLPLRICPRLHFGCFGLVAERGVHFRSVVQ